MFVHFSQISLVSFDGHHIAFWYSSLSSRTRPKPGAVDIVLRLRHISKISRSQLVFKIWATLCERAHWGSIKSKSCRFQCADSLPLLFVHLSNLVREELIMWTLHLPFLLLILRGWVVVQGVHDVNLAPALCSPRPAKTALCGFWDDGLIS